MNELIEWRQGFDARGLESREIILHFDGKEYLLGKASKVLLKRKHFFWEIVWANEVFHFFDDGYFLLRTDVPLESYQKRMNGYIAVNLWRIVRRLKEIEDEKHS